MVLTNMCMVSDGKGNVLVQERKDPNWPGVVFPGGHVEPGESFVESVRREIREETGLTLEDPRLCGVKQFQTREGERYVVLLFRANRYSGQLRSSDEGEVFWAPRERLSQYQLAGDFEKMLPLFEDDVISEYFWDEAKQAPVYY